MTKLAELPPEVAEQYIAESDDLARILAWRQEMARPGQVEPEGDDWNTWLLQAGRGFGKTRTGAEWTAEKAAIFEGCRIALVAPTIGDVRDTQIEGDSGLLSVMPTSAIQSYNRTLAEIITVRGTRIKGFSADAPNRMRGPQHHFAWADELSSWPYEDALDQVLFGLRLGVHPRMCVTTTPKPNPLTKRVMEDPGTVITRGSTFDNAANLSKSALETLKARYEGTRLGRQELYAEFLDDIPGALWTRAMLDAACQVQSIPPLTDVVVSVDPSGSDGETGDHQGIIIAGKGSDGFAYVLDDISMLGSPNEWAAASIKGYDLHRADRIVAERNYGGDMVRAVIQAHREHVPVKMVTATRGKVVRAQPVAALYEQGKVRHVKRFTDLEDQMCLMTSDGFTGRGSPDRVDALVWAITDLMLGGTESQMITVRIG
jgi:phage terminase large subunit-like protein